MCKRRQAARCFPTSHVTPHTLHISFRLECHRALAADREHLPEQLSGGFAVHQRGTDQCNAVAELDDTLHVVQRSHAALRDARIELWELIRELFEPSELDRELLQVAAVEPDEHL